jgi:hypothetical protein
MQIVLCPVSYGWVTRFFVLKSGISKNTFYSTPMCLFYRPDSYTAK